MLLGKGQLLALSAMLKHAAENPEAVFECDVQRACSAIDVLNHPYWIWRIKSVPKPVIHYVGAELGNFIRVGCSAIVDAIDHPKLGSTMIQTSKVISYDEEGGRFETKNSIYERVIVPKPDVVKYIGKRSNEDNWGVELNSQYLSDPSWEQLKLIRDGETNVIKDVEIVL